MEKMQKCLEQKAWSSFSYKNFEQHLRLCVNFYIIAYQWAGFTAQKMKFSVKDFFSKSGLDIIFQRLPDILPGRSAIWPDMPNRNFNIIFIFFALCVGASTRNARLEIQHTVNPQQFNENQILRTTRKGLNIAEGRILTTP